HDHRQFLRSLRRVAADPGLGPAGWPDAPRAQRAGPQASAGRRGGGTIVRLGLLALPEGVAKIVVQDNNMPCDARQRAVLATFRTCYGAVKSGIICSTALRLTGPREDENMSRKSNAKSVTRRTFGAGLGAAAAMAGIAPFNIVRAQGAGLKVGVLLPRSGFQAGIGQDCQRGVDVAAPLLKELGLPQLTIMNADTETNVDVAR